MLPGNTVSILLIYGKGEALPKKKKRTSQNFLKYFKKRGLNLQKSIYSRTKETSRNEQMTLQGRFPASDMRKRKIIQFPRVYQLSVFYYER